MQSPQSIARALYRIVFRGGTPQRIQFSTPLLLFTVGTLLAGLLIGGRYFFNLSIIEIGLAMFTLLSGLYLATALLTRSVPRAKLRSSLLTVLLLLGAGSVLFVLLIPLRELDTGVVLIASVLVSLGVVSGSTNALQYAKGGSRTNAALITLAFAALLGAFYATLHWLLETVFS